jgi:hypothetical protein
MARDAPAFAKARMTSFSPPRWAEHVLRWVLRSQDRDVILGDLLEEYGDIHQSFGRRRADRRYGGQVLSIVAVEAGRRISTTYILIGGWVALFWYVSRLPQTPPPSPPPNTPLDPQLFWLLTTAMLAAVFVGTFLVTGWLWFVLFTRRRRPLRRLQ